MIKKHRPVDLSVIIVNWNTSDLLCKCLKSIYQLKPEVSFEVIVVDNHSSDGSQQMVKTEFPQVKLISNAENEGFAKASNRAIKIASGRYILLLNSDTEIIDAKNFDTIIHFMDTHPECGIAGCKLLNTDRTWQPSIDYEPSVCRAFSEIIGLNKVLHNSRIIKKTKILSVVFPKMFSHFNEAKHNSKEPIECACVLGAYYLIRRDVINEIGILDEYFFLFGEETDYALRAKQKGWKIFYVPYTSIVHHKSQSQKRFVNELYYWHIACYFHLFKKHHPLKALIWKPLAFLGLTWVRLFTLLKNTTKKTRLNQNYIVNKLLSLCCSSDYTNSAKSYWDDIYHHLE